MKEQKGFTLIELLVVIAIISILSSVIIASLSGARTKAKDASAKGSLGSIRASAEVCINGGTACGNYTYGTAGTGTGVCTDTDVAKLLAATTAQTGTAPVCVVAAGSLSYTVYDKLNDTTNSYFCIDSSGFSGDMGNGASLPTAGTAAGNYTAGVYCKHP